MFHYSRMKYTIIFRLIWLIFDPPPFPPTDNLPCHFVSAFGAGFVTTVIASPVDVVKTRYMNSPPGQYRSAINCAWTMMTKEGPTAFYKGWAPPPRRGLHPYQKKTPSFSPSVLHFADLCHRFWGWGRGTSSCLYRLNKSREPWWSRRRRSKPKTEIPSFLCLMKKWCLWGKGALDVLVLHLSFTRSHFWTGMVHFNPNLPLFFQFLAGCSTTPGGHGVT